MKFLQYPMLRKILFVVSFSLLIYSSYCLPCLASDNEDKENELVICVNQPIFMLDPAIHRSRSTQKILKNMLDSLTTRDANMRVVPQLAESWRTLTETAWEFKLKKGVRFHNNEELTAEDVKFSLERIFKERGMEGTTSPRRSLLGAVTEILVEDRYTIIIKTKKPWPILPLMLTFHEIVPKRYMTRVGSKGFQSHPIGTGPFKFVKLEKDHRILMERFEDYYGGSSSIPPVQNAPLKSLVFEYVPLKIKQIQMLKKKECSIIFHVNPNAMEIFQKSPDLRVLTQPATRSYFADLNCRKPPLNDPGVRRALNYAIDIDTIVSTILLGNGIPLTTILLPNSNGYNPALKPYGYNPELAKQLLAEASYDPEYVLQIRCNKDEVQFANNIASFLIKIGLKSEIQIADLRKPSVIGKDAPWDIDVGSWGDSTLDAVGIILPKLQTNGRGNYSGYSNQKIDNLLAMAESTFDLHLRKTYYQKIQEIVLYDAPMIFGYAKNDIYGIRKEVGNFFPSGSGMMNMHDVFVETEVAQ